MLNDTSDQAGAVQLKILREMGPERRSILAAQWSDEVRRTAMAGIRDHNVEFDNRRVLLEYARISMSEELFQAAFGRELTEAR